MRTPVVRIYPSGGIICQRADVSDSMSVTVALRELMAGRPACVWIENLHIVLAVMRPEVKMVPMLVPNALGIKWKTKETDEYGTL